MTTLLCLNELSCGHHLPVSRVDDAVRQFVATLRAIKSDAVLITPVKLPDIDLALDYPMRRWAADGRNKDHWRAIRSMQSRAPFTFAELAPTEQDDDEFRHRDRLASGLGVAHNHDGMAVSLPTHEEWALDAIELDRMWVDETVEEICQEIVTVRHASCTDHVDVHASWLDESRYDTDVRAGRDVWDRRHQFFPALDFLPRVEHDLTDISPVWVRPVFVRLRELQTSAVGWVPKAGSPIWGSKVTPEHDQRKALCRFVDLDGVTRTFDMHARFTPGAGRIHFRLIATEQKFRIAYIGRKLGS
ncbi:hypothetical protein ACFYO1_25670 [Nocardia sp. NPDC006044]|uniref:hypothetical protein n=1 Tax=Nocardia sp. NPDC006044 TaxID=3364306 RepID=UPI00369ECD3B